VSPSLSMVGSLLMGGPTAVVVKATLILAGAAIAAALLRRASAAFRHLVWLLGLSACAALALLSPAAPTIALDLPTTIARMNARPARVRSANVPHARVTTTWRVDRGIDAPVSVVEAVASPRIVAASRALLSTTMATFAPALALGVWLVGCLAILARCFIGHRRIGHIIDSADPLTSPAWSSALESASIDLGLVRDVELLVSDALAAPITSGFSRPVVILPADCSTWTAERRRIVLVHELAHIARLDYVAQLVATLACAIFWFHPGVWFAAAKLRAEAEHAADDRVIGAGTLGVTYATHLLELARGGRDGTLSPAVAVGMIRSSRLEGRFRAMLDSTRSRAAVTPRVQAAAATFMLCAMIPAAGLRTVAHATPARVTNISPRITSSSYSTTITSSASESPTATTIIGAAGGVVSVALQAADDSTFEKTIDASAGERLMLDLRTGAAVVIHGWDEPRIRLVARLSGRDWRDTQVDLSKVSGGVRLRSDFANRGDNQSTSHRFELWVPRRIDIEMSSAGGSLAIKNLSGELSGYTGGGAITIDDASGRASLSTGGGPVTVTNSDLSGTVSTGGGQVYISNVTGGLRGSSGGGDVLITDGTRATTIGSGRGIGAGVGNATTIITNDGSTIRPGQAISGYGGRSTSVATTSGSAGTTVTTTGSGGFATTIATGQGQGFGFGGYSISKAGGQIVLDDLPNGGVLRTGGGEIVVRSSGASVSASTGGGDITLDRVAGNARASTGAGEVRISILDANGAAHSVDVFSGKGRVVLELPASIDARFELETAYTDNFDRRTTIDSDFALDRSETNEWDDREGTPRKYVRALGVFGTGAGLIRVRTVNGDVVVRRR